MSASGMQFFRLQLGNMKFSWHQAEFLLAFGDWAIPVDKPNYFIIIFQVKYLDILCE